MRVSVKEIAGLLNVSEKTIYRWIKQSVIPYYKINGQYRFSQTEILAWAASRHIKVSSEILVEEESNNPLSTLYEAVKSGGIIYRLSGNDQASVLQSLVDSMNLPDNVDRNFLYQVLLTRERMGSTSIGNGIAIPHARNPVVLRVLKPSVTLAFLENPIEFFALDGKPVNILFTIISPSVRVHLNLLSRIGFVLHDKGLQKVLKEQAPREVLMDQIIKAEQEIK